MSDSRDAAARKAPVHLWIVGVVALLWNAMGAFDYVMTETKNDAYLSSFTPEQVEYFLSLPSWFVAFWAIAVWGGLLGAILLLLRKRAAAPVFAVSFCAMLVTTVHSFVLTDGMEIMGTAGAIFSAVIFVVALLLVVYARAMRSRGVLS